MKIIYYCLIAGLSLSISAAPLQIKNLTISANGNKAAQRLADGLKAIYQTDFPVQQHGKVRFTQKPGEGYSITTKNGEIVISGNLENAVSHILHSLGYRHFFPNRNWVVIPPNPPENIDINVSQAPAFLTRKIWPGWGLWHDYRGSGKINDLWNLQNRNGGFRLHTGHTYGLFIRHNRDIFKKHPEYYALVGGVRKGSKQCISNPGLRKLFVGWAIKRLKRKPGTQCVSAEPSDGGGWCECAECAKLGTPSDRALLLANETAEAVSKINPQYKVGMYAYNQHSPAPSKLRAHPNVIISVATRFIRQGWNVDQLITGWRRAGAAIGIREYYFSQIAPGTMRSEKTAESIRHLHRLGAKYMIAESYDAWGSGGLPFYVASRLLWNPNEDLKAIKDDFFKRAFPRSEKPVRDYYKLIDGPHQRPLSKDLLGRMYRALGAARKLAGNDELKRVNDLIKYTRFCELYYHHRANPTIKSYHKLLSFGAAIRDSQMVHTYAMYRDNRALLPSHLRKKKIPPVNWKNTPPLTSRELDTIVAKGIANNKLIGFQTVQFSDNLLPVNFPGKNSPGQTGPVRSRNEFYFWSDGKPLKVQVTGGLIKHYRDRGNVKLELVQIGGPSATGELETVVQKDASVPPDGKSRTVTLTPKHPGLHRLVMNDGGDMSKILFPASARMTVIIGDKMPRRFSGTFFFYVPKSTKTLGFFAKTRRGRLIEPDGKTVKKLTKLSGYYSVPARPGIWQLNRVNGYVKLLTVPSGLSVNSNQMLLPAEVVKQDKLITP